MILIALCQFRFFDVAGEDGGLVCQEEEAATDRLFFRGQLAERADGVEAVGNGDFIVSCWAGLVYYVYADGRIEQLLDSRALKLNTADIGWDAATRTLYIPTFFGNSVRAFQLKDNPQPE